MPGPGGGGHGGGGGRGGGGGFGGGGPRGGGGGFGGGPRGGGFGGGPRGGGFGGPHGHRPPPHHGGMWHHRHHRYGYYGGGGCLGGLLGMIIAPIILVLFAVLILFSSFHSAFASLSQGGDIVYEEETFQDYADAQYAAEFGSSAAYEDHILIVVLTDEEYYDYVYIAWVGDHIVTDVNNLFGNDYTKLGQAMNASINASSYKYSLDSNLAQVVEKMEDEVTSLGLSSPFKCEENHTSVSSHLTNKTALPLTTETVNTALAEFTEATGISMVIVVDDAEDVFGRSISFESIFFVILAVGMIVLAVWLIVRAVRSRRDGDQGGDDNGQQTNGTYYDNWNQ